MMMGMGMPIIQPMMPFMGYSFAIGGSDPAHQDKDQQNDDNKPKPARGAVAPVLGMAPVWQRADKRKDKDDQKDRAD